MFSNLKSLSYSNWSCTCRFCFSSQNLVNIFNTNGLILKIVNILSLKIHSKDNLPDKICVHCLNKLETTKNIVELIILSTKKLCEYIKFLGINLIDIDDIDLTSKINLVDTKPQTWVHLKYLCYDNWYNVCRFCFCPKDLYDLYKTTEFVDKIKFLTGMKISNSQKLPNKICCDCQNMIISAHSFVSDCSFAVKKLRTYLEFIDMKVSSEEETEENNNFVQAKPESENDEDKSCEDKCDCFPKRRHRNKKDR